MHALYVCFELPIKVRCSWFTWSCDSADPLVKLMRQGPAQDDARLSLADRGTSGQVGAADVRLLPVGDNRLEMYPQPWTGPGPYADPALRRAASRSRRTAERFGSLSAA